MSAYLVVKLRELILDELGVTLELDLAVAHTNFDSIRHD
jgi:hypothetical protein